MSNIRNDRGKNTTDFSEIQMNTKECLENVFYPNSEEIYMFLCTCNLPKLN